ncbi:MAG TPA: hypothetical protein VFZ00_10915 [Solirubrobacter sp.]|nr:hypothetical protein [Solirubrobacter sp.]
MAFHRSVDPSDPRGERIGRLHEERRTVSRVMATGSMACPRCDAPVMPSRPMAPSEALWCGFCGHDALVRDFLSLEQPTRPARVEIRIR